MGRANGCASSFHAAVSSGLTREENVGATGIPLQDLSGIRVNVVFHDRNAGKGSALRSGLAVASGSVFVFHDADLEYDPADWAEMYDLIAVRQVADVVYGSRFHGDRGSFPLNQYVGNRLITLLFNSVYQQTLSDVEVCTKMFSRQVKETIDLTCADFGCEIQFSAQVSLSGRWRIREVGVSYTGRSRAEGKKIRWTDGVKALWYLAKFRFDRAPGASPRRRETIGGGARKMILAEKPTEMGDADLSAGS